MVHYCADVAEASICAFTCQGWAFVIPDARQLLGAPAAAAAAGPARGAATEDNPIAAVLVFKDPTDWYRDVQLVLDVVMSGDGSCCRRGCCASPSPADHSVGP